MAVASFRNDPELLMQDLQRKLAMSPHPLSIYFPNVDHVIERCPLIVTPETPLVEVIPLMGKIRTSCILDNWHPSLDYQAVLGEARADCALVMQESHLVGIFTERDLVGLSASARNLERVTIADVMTSPVTTLQLSEFRNIFTALSRLRSAKIRHLPIVNEQGDLVGVVSHDSIRSCLQPLHLLKIRTVAEVMTTSVITASVTTPVLELAQLMAQHRISCVVITQQGGGESAAQFGNESSTQSPYHPLCPNQSLIPVGIVTERDIVQFQALELDLSKTVAGDIMSTPPLCVSPEDSLLTVHQQMQQRYVRRLVVCSSQDELLGIITQTNLLQAFDPLEMYGTIELMQQVVEERTADLKTTNERLQQQIIERKQAQEACYIAQAQYQSIFENAVEGIFQTTPDGRYLSANPALARIYGYDSPAQLMSTITDINRQLYVDPNRRAEFVSLMQEQDTVSDFESQAFTRDGSVIWTSEKARAVRDAMGRLLYYEGFVEDITARKQAEAEVLKALAREKELNQFKSEYVSMISHDFRTPLNTILISSGLLQASDAQWPQEKKFKHFRLIRSAIKSMVDLLNQVLLMGKSDAGKLECQPASLDLKKFCCELAEEAQFDVGEKYQIVFESTGEFGEAILDKGLLRHILINLLSNAIKYSPDGGMIRLKLTREDETAIFEIQDEGIGISTEDQKRLFQPFDRGKNVGKIPGTGLGLTIVKKCVEAHGGEISVSSEVGVGSTFTVTLPLTDKVV
jgi:PAS domain S-box-containing protein